MALNRGFRKVITDGSEQLSRLEHSFPRGIVAEGDLVIHSLGGGLGVVVLLVLVIIVAVVTGGKASNGGGGGGGGGYSATPVSFSLSNSTLTQAEK